MKKLCDIFANWLSNSRSNSGNGSRNGREVFPMSDEWVEILSAHTRAEADLLFKAWRDKNPLIDKELKDEDVRVDTIRTQEKQNLTRYSIRKI
ncbi:MAG: hypothetical protein KF713_11245 [Turneriella sp.]|nr:hypothetical protein [Turneriella sp.]